MGSPNSPLTKAVRGEIPRDHRSPQTTNYKLFFAIRSAMGGCASTPAATKAVAVPAKASVFATILASSQNYQLSMQEFTEFIINEKLGVTKEQAEAMFTHADENANGFLCAKELSAVVDAVRESAMTLPVRVIVPSTQDVSGKISAEEMQARCDQVISCMAATFGGATASAPQHGAFRADSGEIVFEEVQSVTSFCTQALWQEHVVTVRTKVGKLCAEWGQECIGLEFAGFLEYIYPAPPSPAVLWTSVVSRLRKRCCGYTE